MNQFVIHTASNRAYHSVLGKWEDECSADELRLFQRGTEQESIEHRLFRPPSCLHLVICPTLGCTLRCPHCYVLGHLDDQNHGPAFSNQDLVSFIQRYRTKYGSINPTVSYVGGEPMLFPHWCLESLHAMRQLDGMQNIRSNVTTNLAYELNDHVLGFLNEVQSILVSVDGTRQTHNKQRIWADSRDEDCWVRVMRNLYMLVNKVDRDKISVQACVDDEDLTDQNVLDYFFSLEAAGIPPSRATIGHKAVTKWHGDRGKPCATWQRNGILYNPCCSFRLMEHIVVLPDGSLCACFHDIEASHIGTIHDSIEQIEERFKSFIRGCTPAMADHTCNQCKALGACWGRCTTSRFHTGGKPSRYCNSAAIQKTLLESVCAGRYPNRDQHHKPS